MSPWVEFEGKMGLDERGNYQVSVRRQQLLPPGSTVTLFEQRSFFGLGPIATEAKAEIVNDDTVDVTVTRWDERPIHQGRLPFGRTEVYHDGERVNGMVTSRTIVQKDVYYQQGEYVHGVHWIPVGPANND